jgi:hypothetical protein
MRWIFSIVLLLIAASVPTWLQTGNTQSGQVQLQQEMIKLEHTKDKAYQTGDKQLLDRLYADDYVAISSTGVKTTKKQILDFFVRPNIFESHTSDDLSVRIFGDTALVTGIQKRKFYKDIKSGGEDSLRFTDIYVLQQGQWRIVAAQFTRAK